MVEVYCRSCEAARCCVIRAVESGWRECSWCWRSREGEDTRGWHWQAWHSRQTWVPCLTESKSKCWDFWDQQQQQEKKKNQCSYTALDDLNEEQVWCSPGATPTNYIQAHKHTHAARRGRGCRTTTTTKWHHKNKWHDSSSGRKAVLMHFRHLRRNVFCRG